MDKIKNLLKRSPIAMVVAGILVAGIASAALLTIYGKLTGTADVEQSVLVNGKGYTDEQPYSIGQSSAIAGDTYTNEFMLENKSETTAPIKFVTTQCIVGGGNCGDPGHNEKGVTTRYYAVLSLENKNPSNWEPDTDDIIKGTLTYDLVSPTFNYEFEAIGLTPNESYSLIYYADKPERFENWGGNNPGALIMTATADSDGKISEEGNKDLGMNLPASPDWNATAEANYCDKDSYDLCRGAKVWLVPTEALPTPYPGNGEWSFWNAEGILFETDLITYDDFGPGGEETLYLGKGKIKVYVDNSFAVDLMPGEYKIKTEVVPVQ